MTVTPDSVVAAAAHAEALRALRSGERRAALSGALMALALDPSVRAHRALALELLGATGGYRTLPAPVLAGLRACAADATLDLQPLALVVKTLLEANARFAALERTLAGPAADVEAALAAGAWAWFCDEPMLLGVLSRATPIGVRLERVLTALRRHALMWSAGYQTRSAWMERHGALAVAMALHVNAARFAWTARADEREALDTCIDPIVRAMYLPLEHLDGPLPDVLHAARAARRALRTRADALPALTAIDDGVSQRVRAQYERYPYPPWDAPPAIAPTTLGAFLAARFPALGLTAPARPALLSAGCGTGRGALMLALTFPAAEVVAFDLSRTSLAYAALKAEQHGAANIAFGVGDILNVAHLGRRFDLIECAGVLHHMADPAAGLRALTAVLAPGGVMRLALYSARGRTAVNAARQVIAARAITDSDAGVRAARQVLLELPPNHPARGVIDTPEFFTLDGLHDLIFNVQEARFTPRGLRELLTAAGLEFLGFDHADLSVRAAFAAMFPHDSDGRDLDNWEAFEQRHPDAFAEMYQFWCRRGG